MNRHLKARSARYADNSLAQAIRSKYGLLAMDERRYRCQSPLLEVAAREIGINRTLLAEYITGKADLRKDTESALKIVEDLGLGLYPVAAHPPVAGDVPGLEQSEVRRHIFGAMKAVLPRQYRIVLIMRFGFDGTDGHTLSEIAAKLNVTPERVRQVEANALRRLREQAPLRTLCRDPRARLSA